MEYSCSHVVFLCYEALFYILGIFQLSDTKFCAYLKMCNFFKKGGFPMAPLIYSWSKEGIQTRLFP